MKDYRVELKVCEACGGLWLRARGMQSSGAYCNSCVRWLAEFPAPKRKQSGSETQRRRRERNRLRLRAARIAKANVVTEVVG